MRKHLLIILCTLLLTIGCKLHDSELHGVSIDKIRDAKEIALQQNSRVHIVSAIGRRKNNEFMTNPEMTEVFKFIATVYDPYGSIDSIWGLVCVDDEWSIITDSLEDMGSALSIDLEDVEMDVCDAWDLIQEEYEVDSFYVWALYQPVPPSFEHPFFSFTIAAGAFFVDVITSEITSMIFELH